MKVSPSTLLASLIAMASVGGAVLHSKKISKQSTGSLTQQKQITALQEQIDKLQSENQTLKNLQESGTEITLPIAHFKFVEDNIGFTFPKHVIARRVDQDTMMEAVRYRYIKQFTMEGMNLREYAFHKLGFLPIGETLLPQIALAETVGAICLYDASSNELLLSAEYDEENPVHASSVIKHLAIALLEQNFPLTKQQAVFLTDDAFHTRNGFIRGRSSSVAQRYSNINAFKKDADGHQKLAKPNLEAQEFFSSLPTLIRGLITFPAVHGKTYIEDIILNNDSVFPEIYLNMPKSSSTIFAKKMPLEETFRSQPQVAENEYLNTQLGQVHTMLYLKQLENSPVDLHTKLTSDLIIVSQNITDPAKRNEYTISWTTHWKTSEAAKSFLQSASQISRAKEQQPTVKISELSENQVIIQFIDIHNS